METLLEYKCPSCGGAIHFESATQKMKCPYCDTEFSMEDMRAYDEELKNAKEDRLEWEGFSGEEWQEEGVVTYLCQSCGGEVVGDENTAATACPFCGNPVVMKGKISGTWKPDLVIPFHVDKEGAKEALRKLYKGKTLLPKVFANENQLNEVKGIYVPFWLYDATADADMRFRATRVRTWADSQYYYTATSHFSVIRSGTLGFAAVPVDGASKMPNDLMESIEPFDLSQAVDFQTAYLAGYFADKYDENAEACAPYANERIRNSTESEFRSTVTGYSTVSTEHSAISLSNSKARYALLPVWLLNTSWKGKTYTFAVNGQTGAIAGNLPMHVGKFFGWLFGLFLGLGAIGIAVSYWIAMGGAG